MDNELIVIDAVDPVEIYTGGQVDPLLAEITRKAKDFTADVQTLAGRNEIKSMAHKVARSKTALDELGKKLVEDWKNRAKAVDATRKHIRDYLDQLKADVRQPLTRWELEQARIEEEERKKAEFESAWSEAIAENELFDRQREIERKEAEIKRLEEERLAKEAAERAAREQKEREERIAREAAEKALRYAEERAQKELEAVKRREIESKIAIEKAERELIYLQEKAERERIEAAEKAEKAKLEAIAEERRRAAAEAEAKEIQRRKIIEDEQRKNQELSAATAEKAADKSHQAKINREVLGDLSATVPFVSETELKQIICAIAKGFIRHTKIIY